MSTSIALTQAVDIEVTDFQWFVVSVIFWADACVTIHWIHFCIGPNYDLSASYRNVATVLKWGGQNYSLCVQFLYDVARQKIVKID